MVNIQDSQGAVFSCRLLLDSGSQSHFMTESLATSLGLKRHKSPMLVTGINTKTTAIRHTLRTVIKSRYNGFQQELEFSVIPRITDELPTAHTDRNLLHIPKNINLADPQFHVPHKVDGLLGADIFFSLLCIGQIKHDNQPTLQKTVLGWIVCGRTNNQNSNHIKKQTVCNFSHNLNLEELMSAFWEVENCENRHPLSKQEQECEEHYMSHVSRTDTGRIMVQLPFSKEISQLGSSREQAETRLKSLEQRLSRHASLRESYVAFMDEYHKSNHMELVEEEREPEDHYYMPHHPVIKNSSLNTKIRVVFDASSRTSTGISLNQALMVGPTIQRDLIDILLSFRLPRYVFCADIKQMYRQVLMHPIHRDFQRIVWRRDSDQPIQIYKLNTVTYGTSAAPYLAIKSLHYLADLESVEFPLASRCIKNDFYVDDVLTGCNSMETVQRLQRELVLLLKRGGFELHKWCSNNPQLLEFIDSDNIESEYLIQGGHDTKKTLGVRWKPDTDTFHYKTTPYTAIGPVTKRSILSEICRLFDPLGLISPVLVKAKVLMQTLWQLEISWDETVPTHIYNTWTQYKKQLEELNNLVINRRITSLLDVSTIEFHGFCDASERCFGACIYLRCTDVNGKTSTYLLCAKSRVAPIKNISLPRLELCGAVLLARLTKKISNTLGSNINSYTFWTDSTILLHWLASPPNTWKTFVANRVSEIQTATKHGTWYHIKSQQNPADILSRGAFPKELINCALWWTGPPWLAQERECWPSSLSCDFKSTICKSIELEERKTTIAHTSINSTFELKTKYSCWAKLLRITAYCKRFIHNLKTPANNIKCGPLMVEEIQNARVFWIRQIHLLYFSEEIHDLNYTCLLYTSRCV